MSIWAEMTISAPSRPKTPVYVGRDADGEITNHIKVAKTKTKEIQPNEGQKRPKKNSVRYPFYFVEKKYNKKSLEGKFKNKIQTAVSGTKSTVRTQTGKIIYQNCFRAHYFRPNEEGSGNHNKRWNIPEELTLPTGSGRQVRTEGRNTPWHIERKTEDRPEPESNGHRYGRKRWRWGWWCAGRNRDIKNIRHFRAWRKNAPQYGQMRKRMHYKSTQMVR